MTIYLLIVALAFIVMMNSNWDVPYNSDGSFKFKFMFNIISALIWPVFLGTLIYDGIKSLFRKISITWKF